MAADFQKYQTIILAIFQKYQTIMVAIFQKGKQMSQIYYNYKKPRETFG